MSCNLDGPSFSCPSFSVNPSVRTADPSLTRTRKIAVDLQYSNLEERLAYPRTSGVSGRAILREGRKKVRIPFWHELHSLFMRTIALRNNNDTFQTELHKL